MFRLRSLCQPKSLLGLQRRFLNLHEYQSKAILKEHGCNVEFGIPCKTIEEVEAALHKIKSEKKVVKSQILAGGRGKGTFRDGFQGGVHVCDDIPSALSVAKRMLGNTLITKQTGPEGRMVRQLYITEAIPSIKRELYIALILDRQTCCPTFVASAEGGMGIEELAKTHPEKIKKMRIRVADGLDKDACAQFAQSLGFLDESIEKVVKQLQCMYNTAKSNDCTQVEINPFVELTNGDVLCIDAKLSFDDNAEYRHADIFSLADRMEMDQKEIEAKSFDLNYIALSGNVGCLVNGAGLAMATMDLISLYGGRPANFLDVGGSATAIQITKAFQIIAGDDTVRSILVNIFGGIMRCDVIAEGILAAVKDTREIPIVVRLSGTKQEEGRKLLEESGLAIYPAEDFESAAKIACQLAKEGKGLK